MFKGNLMNTYARFDIIFEKGKGSYLYSRTGKKYLDFVAGIAVNCLGHSHPSIIDAIEKQNKKLIHISNLYWNEPQIQLAEKLVNYSEHQQVFFTNSGSEAIETALKLARKYGKLKGGYDKNRILYMKNSFHGRTLGALAITGQEKYQKDFMPLIGGVEEVYFNNIEDLKSKADPNLCAIIMEPIQGEGGIIPADITFLKEARQICDQFDALLIFDEIQCGMGRTGKLFAYQAFDIIPDIICMAKGLGGGFPIGAVLAKDRAGHAFSPGDHGSTFGGNPLACAVASAVLEEITQNKFLDEVVEKSDYLVKGLNKLKTDNPMIQDIRGKGLMLGISFDRAVGPIVQNCFEKGLLLVAAGEKTIRMVPALNISKEEIDEALRILEDAISHYKE